MKMPSDFIAHIQASGEFARTNKFEVTVTPPSDITIDNDSLERICTNCISAKIPGRTFDQKIWNQGGAYARKMANTIVYADLSLKFRLSQDLLEKRFFDMWQDMIADPIYQNLNYYEKYASGIVTVRPLTRVIDKKVGLYTYSECWPISVMEIDVDVTSDNQIAELSVDFAYRGWAFNKDE